jgi:hypothetical protein
MRIQGMFLEFMVTKMCQRENEIRLYRTVCNGYIHKDTFRDENISVHSQMHAVPYLMATRKPFFGIKKKEM